MEREMMLKAAIQTQKEEAYMFSSYVCNLGYRVKILCVCLLYMYVYQSGTQEGDYEKEEKLLKGARKRD